MATTTNGSIELTELFQETNSATYGKVFTSLRKWVGNGHVDYVLSYGVSGIDRKMAYSNRDKSQSELIRLAIHIFDELMSEFNRPPALIVNRECPNTDECANDTARVISSKWVGEVYVCVKCMYVEDKDE